MNLIELQDAVRTQLGVDVEELPNATVNLFLRDAFGRMTQLEQRWPFYQQTWPLTTIADTVAYPKDSTVSSIVSVYDLTGKWPLSHIDHTVAEQAYGDGTSDGGTPAYWSEWGGSVYLWPRPSGVRSYQIRGYRKPLDWITSGGGVDADERLHIALIYFAVSLAYAQQEDEVLEATYMQRYTATVQSAREDVMRDASQWRPVIMSGGVRPTIRNQVVLVP